MGGRRNLICAICAISTIFVTTVDVAWAQPTPASTQAPVQLDSIAVSEVQIDPKIQTSSYFSAPILTRAVESALDATRKFRVVSRSAAEAKGTSEEAKNALRAGRLFEQATYLVVIEVLGADLKAETAPVPNLPRKVSTQFGGRVEMNVAVLVAANRRVKSRFPIEGRFAGQRIVHDTDSPPSEAEKNLAFVDLAQQVGRRLADRVLDEVFPVQVVQRQGNLVFLNRGEDSGFQVGESLRIFSGGEERLIDPYTKEDLGPLETQIGTVRVSDLRPKITIAEVVSETSPIGQGALVRRPVDRNRN